MTKEKFIAIQSRRGYEVTVLGKMVILNMTTKGENYTAIWFFNEDGTPDESQKPSWSIKRV